VGSIFVDGWRGRWESAKVNESKGKSYPTLCDPLKLDEYFFKRPSELQQHPPHYRISKELLDVSLLR